MKHYPLALAGLLGATGVVLGALGAHALAARLGEAAAVWDTAVTYHLVHAAACLGLALVNDRRFDRAARVALVCFAAGVVLFSGSLYVLALDGPRWIGPITPIGGLLLMAGWLALAWAAWRG